ncbi:hypothetical protein AB0L56_31345 [Streptomyces sp. NPDC052079]
MLLHLPRMPARTLLQKSAIHVAISSLASPRPRREGASVDVLDLEN